MKIKTTPIIKLNKNAMKRVKKKKLKSKFEIILDNILRKEVSR